MFFLGFGRIVAAFEQLDCVPARWGAEIWPVVLRDVEPVKQVLCKSALRTKQVVLMPHATQVLLLPSLVCFAIVKYKYPTEARLGPLVGKLQQKQSASSADRRN